MNTVFVTGATGAVGSAIVAELLHQPDTNIGVLIRATDEQHLKSRIDELWAFWKQLGIDENLRPRVAGYAGDVTLARLGLDKRSYDGLMRRCTHIVHSAGAVRMNLPLEEARRHSVDAAKGVIGLARGALESGRFRKLEYVSTVGVGGRDRAALPETWISRPWAFHNTYEAGKFEAECHIREAVSGGLPVTVHRPSMVVGNARTGAIIHFQVFYHICEFLSGKRTRGVYPIVPDAKVDTVPADYVARAVAWSIQQETAEGRILHLCSGDQQALSLDTIRQSVRTLFRAEGRLLSKRSIGVPLPVFQAAVPIMASLSPPKLRRSIRTLPAFLTYLKESKAFENHNTCSLLERHGIGLPKPEEYLQSILRYYLSRQNP